MKSMTAYGRGSFDAKYGTWMVEIASVNRKSLEIQVYTPKHLLQLEYSLRKWIGSLAHRGHITVRASLASVLQHEKEAELARLRKEKKKWDGIALELGYEPKVAIDFKFLMEKSSEIIEGSSMEDGLKEAFMLAAEEWQTMREKEGSTLEIDLVERIVVLRKYLETIEAHFPSIIEAHRARLKEKFKEVCLEESLSEERVARELSILADKWDVSEEITRIFSHLTQLEEVMKKKGSHLGRTIDFIIQELHREINTLGAKSSDLPMIRMTLEMKGELEKIKEQVQNIE